LARGYAPARLESLNQQLLSITEERAEILREFPELNTPLAATKTKRVIRVVHVGTDGTITHPADPELVVATARKKRSMSIEQRLAVGRRMSAYWRRRRAEMTKAAAAKAKARR
jgi:hypothetical protein